MRGVVVLSRAFTPGEGDDAAIFNLTQADFCDDAEPGEAEREVKERGDEGALAADILEDLNTDSIRSLRRSFDVIGGEDGVQEGEFVKMMMAYLNPDDGRPPPKDEVWCNAARRMRLEVDADLHSSARM